MTNVIVTTSTREQQEVMSVLRERLKVEYLTDTTITVVQSGITKIDIYQLVKGNNLLAGSYIVVIVPVSMSLDSINGFSPTANININRLIKHLDVMKTQAIAFVNSRKQKPLMVRSDKEAFKTAINSLFKQE
jgi:hypothetical protein